MNNRHPAIVIGAGPAGLSAAHELVQHDIHPLVLEKADLVGGIARTETHRGYRFDIGGHRFFTPVHGVRELWQEMLGESLIEVQRLSRIYYDSKFFSYPLDPLNTLSNLGPIESARVLLSYLAAMVRPHPQEDTFEQWIINRFGNRIYQTFFRAYTEKVWGIPCSEIQADWAAQRIRGLSVRTVVSNALFGSHATKSLIGEFLYPVLGPGWMWERFQEAVETHGGQVQLGTEVVRLERDGARIVSATVLRGGQEETIAADHFLSSMPLNELIARMHPAPPEDVVGAAGRLRYRDFVLVGLVVNRAELFPDQWIYIHSPSVRVGRIQNPKNWSAALVPDASKTSLGMEYFCTEGDDVWSMSTPELVELASAEVAELGLAKPDQVEDGVAFWQPKAYPIYDREYRACLDSIARFLGTLTNLQTIGRNGMHRYNNQDHSMLTGILAARNLLGEGHDLWSVNTEQSYLEVQPDQDRAW